MRQHFRSSTFAIRHSRQTAFSLVELLTVIFIIALLIGILIPSLNSARNTAKKLTTAKTLDSVKVGLELFKGDNGPDFAQSNGYPPSFSHPPIPGYAFQPELGQFPFIENKPQVTGAHWLPAMLMGVDKLGFIKRGSVPNLNNLRAQPYRWYTPDATTDGKPLERVSGSPYLDVNLRTLPTKQLPGQANRTLFPDWDAIQDLPVIVDAFDQPILYYAANSFGRTSNMVAATHPLDGNYPGGPQETGPPYYFHQDNAAFTGNGVTDAQRGWNFGNLPATGHWIAQSGDTHTVLDLIKGAAPTAPDDVANYWRTFARYIVDRKVFTDLTKPTPTPPPATAPLRPVNSDSYLLISAGVDGIFGTQDDVSNLPPFPSL